MKRKRGRERERCMYVMPMVCADKTTIECQVSFLVLLSYVGANPIKT